MWFGIREATETDIPDIYKYIHKRFMEKYTDMDKEEAFKRHYEWYKEALKSEEHKVYIIYNKSDNFIGQIRYEISKSKARVGIYLLEEVRGYRISEKALNKSIELLTAEKPNIKQIIANIVDENERSIYLFKKCGFKYSRKKNGMFKFIKSID